MQHTIEHFFLSLVRDSILECKSCELYKSRINIVFGSGSPGADLMLIGEAPGKSEDEKGLPFIGQSGKLLDKWLKSIKLSRDQIYIANILKCRPPDNRNPKPDEVENCRSYLNQQISIIRPSVIVLLGAVALKTLYDDKNASIMKERGKWRKYMGIKVMPTYHPAFLLRQMSAENKKKVKQDLKAVSDILYKK